MSTATAIPPTPTRTWQTLCARDDLVAHSGVAAWLDGTDTQVALLYLPGRTPEIYAVDNHDPFSNANVMLHVLCNLWLEDGLPGLNGFVICMRRRR